MSDDYCTEWASAVQRVIRKTSPFWLEYFPSYWK